MIKIVAEVGCNWATMEEAKQFIDKSAELELWATKFQIYNHAEILDHPQRSFLRSIMIEEKEARELFEYGQDIGQEVFFSVMYPEAVDWLEEIGVNYYKIRYADQNNLYLKYKIINTHKEYFISTDYYENGKSICLLCVPKYPANIWDYFEKINISFWNKYQGISDHTSNCSFLKEGIEKGIEYWEKHVKLDNTTPLEDAWSVSFSELKEVLNK